MTKIDEETKREKKKDEETKRERKIDEETGRERKEDEGRERQREKKEETGCLPDMTKLKVYQVKHIAMFTVDR